MPSADEISRSIEPGSTQYGDRQVVEDRIAQVMQSGNRTAAPPGAASQAGMGKLEQGPVSDLPVTDGLSVGPGAGPAPADPLAGIPKAEQLRILAKEARSPRIRALARSSLRAMVRGH